MPRKNRTPALAYLRTSSATNVGAEKDSDTRQRSAIEAFAKQAGFEIVAEFYDQAVSGADPLEARPGFAAMLERIAGNGALTIIVETANRFARDLIVQETGHRMLKERGIEIIAADSPSAFVDDTPTTTFVRQVLGAVAQLDKAMTVAKLRGGAIASVGRPAGVRAELHCAQERRTHLPRSTLAGERGYADALALYSGNQGYWSQNQTQ